MSALIDKVYTLGNLIEFGPNGLSVASFVDIKRTLIERQRQLYGVDIDVSDASADGQWITEIALLLNNILQAFNSLYADLNPMTAQGKALDLLASFSNIARKPATSSTCEVVLTKETNSQFDLDAETSFIDKNDNIWLIDKNRTELLPALVNGYYSYSAEQIAVGVTIPLICATVGAIAIPANSILSFANITTENATVMIDQSTAGITGTIEESDSHLRARRNNSAANEAITIIDGIQGALLNNPLIIDAYVINHTSPGASGTGIDAHTVEVITRSKYPANDYSGIKKFIANTIYNRLTPGIPTTHDTTTTGTNKNTLYTFVESIDNTSFVKATEWVEAKPISPVLEITLHKLANCNTAVTAQAVIAAVAEYANNLGLLKDMTSSELLQEIFYADPKFQGRQTFYCAPQMILIDGNEFIFKLSEETDNMSFSAETRKTFYKYDNTCTLDDTQTAETYHNAGSTIVIIFED